MMRAATLIPICLIALFGCGERAQPGGTETERLPVSLNEIMVALVNQSADCVQLA